MLEWFIAEHYTFCTIILNILMIGNPFKSVKYGVQAQFSVVIFKI